MRDYIVWEVDLNMQPQVTYTGIVSQFFRSVMFDAGGGTQPALL